MAVSRSTVLIAAAVIAVLAWGLHDGTTGNEPIPACSDAPAATRVLLQDQGMLESIAFDRAGRLLYTDMGQKALRRLDRPNASPVTVAGDISGPGGIAVVDEHTAYVGTGNGLSGLLPSLGLAGIAKVDLDRGTVTPVVKGLSMANGLVRASDGTFYASDDLSRSLDRVLPDGTVQRGWLAQNSNGLVLSADEKTLYVNQFVPARVMAIDRATNRLTVLAEPPSSGKWAWLDGLEIDASGRLYAAAYWAGEVWRIEKTGSICVLARGLHHPSALAVGRAGQGFSPSSLYVTTHGGTLHELPQVIAAQP